MFKQNNDKRSIILNKTRGIRSHKRTSQTPENIVCSIASWISCYCSFVARTEGANERRIIQQFYLTGEFTVAGWIYSFMGAARTKSRKGQDFRTEISEIHPICRAFKMKNVNMKQTKVFFFKSKFPCIINFKLSNVKSNRKM